MIKRIRILIMAILGLILFIYGSIYFYNYSPERSVFIENAKNKFKNNRAAVKLSELFSNEFDTICILEGYDIPDERALKLEKMKTFKNFNQAKNFAEFNQKKDDRYLIFLIANKTIKEKFVLTNHFYIGNETYSLKLYSQSQACYKLNETWLTSEQARNSTILKLTN